MRFKKLLNVYIKVRISTFAALESFLPKPIKLLTLKVLYLCVPYFILIKALISDTYKILYILWGSLV